MLYMLVSRVYAVMRLHKLSAYLIREIRAICAKSLQVKNLL
ncbi:hypothetical protein KSX_02830 [Ktedonospora formicarum]|uniref:Uncharacterized protein n=1 Tax=Ktedonospora formicarum TaxID=2778364 RepID=A0A8J3HW66_9CHLR|nr:hypothetical protein KSX_02830 [Ktedonospora formicarum]